MVKRIKRNISADFYIISELNAEFFNERQFLVKHFFRQSVLRYAVAEHAAHLRHHIENSDAVSFYCKIICRRYSARTAAYNRDLFARRFGNFRHEYISAFKVAVCRISLERGYRYRLFNESAPALFLARMRTHSAYGSGQRNFALYYGQRLGVFFVGNESDVSLAVGARWAGERAWGFAVSGVIRKQHFERESSRPVYSV